MPTLQDLEERPHISLAVLPEANRELLVSVTKEHAADTAEFDLQLSAIGTFPTEENVLFLSPVRTDQLSSCHRDFHRCLAELELVPVPYYLPGNWIPHCSVEMNVTEEQLARGIEICKRHFRPLRGRFLEVGVIEFRPLRRLGTWMLADA